MTEQTSTALGIELGSTRIKAVLVDETGAVLASGAHDWENRFEGGYWTYHLEDAQAGVRDAYARLAADRRMALEMSVPAIRGVFPAAVRA